MRGEGENVNGHFLPSPPTTYHGNEGEREPPGSANQVIEELMVHRAFLTASQQG